MEMDFDMSDVDDVPPLELLEERSSEGEKTYQVRCVAAILDPEDERVITDFSGARMLVDNPVPVVSAESGGNVGVASIYQEGGRILAELTLEYACAERLLIQSGAAPVYPKLLGDVYGEDVEDMNCGNTEDGEVFDDLLAIHERPNRVREFTVRGLLLTRNRPSDLRLERVGEVVVL